MVTNKKDTNAIPAEDLGARKKILTAAASLFAKQGLEGTSTRDIAKESGLNLSLISYYFGGKEGLYKAVIHEFAIEVKEKIEELVARFDSREMDADSLRELLGGMVDVFVDIRILNPNASMIMAREKLAGLPNAKEIHEQVFVHIGEKVKNLIERGQKKGYVNKKINPYFFVCCLAESMSGYFVMLDSPTTGKELRTKCFDLPMEKEEFKSQITLLFLEGIFK